MNEPISILELVLNASVVVQLVMAILILASLVSWVLIFQRAFLLQSVRRSAANFEDEFWSGQDLRSIFVDIESSEAEVIGVEHIFQAGFKEFTRSRQQYGNQAERIMQNVQRSMRVALAREEERLEAALPFLATVGSTAPFIGLFGTVWGIMNSFQSIAISRNTSLAIVAPGIAEALFATALGLLAAIPAVVAYNKFNSDSRKYSIRIENFSKRFISII